MMLMVQHGYTEAAVRLFWSCWELKRDDTGRNELHVLGNVEILDHLLTAYTCPSMRVNARDNYGRTPLFYAKNADIANKLLDAGANPDHRDSLGCTAFSWTEREDVAVALLARGATSSPAHGPNRRTAFMMAAKWNNLDMVKQLLQIGHLPSINDEDSDKRTALWHAVQHRSSAELVKTLLDAGADANVADKDGNSPLHIATDCGIIRLLVESGAALDHSNNSGFTALHLRCMNKDTDAASLLLSLGADAETWDHAGQTVLMHAAENGLVDVARDVLSRYPGTTDVRSVKGQTALFIAVERQHSGIIAALLDAGASVSICDEKRRSPLMVCADVGVAERLLSLGADLHATDASDRNALIYACAAGYIDVVSFLLKNKADPDPSSSLYAEDEDRWPNDTALMAACRNNHPGIVDLLLAPENSPEMWVDTTYNREASALDYAIDHASLSMVSGILAVGAEFEPDTHGMPALHTDEDRAVARLLLDVIKKRGCRGGDSAALFYACSSGYCEMIEWLSEIQYDHDYDVNAVHFRDTAGSLAFSSSEPLALPTLLSVFPSYDVNLRSYSGRTVLHSAAESGPHSAVQLLLDARADPTIADNNGNIPLSCVYSGWKRSSEDCLETMRLLIEAAPKTVYHRNSDGCTILMKLCADHRFSRVFEGLLRISSECNVPINVNEKDNGGRTALHYTDVDEVNLLDLLLLQGAEVLGSDSNGTTVLMNACDPDSECLERLYLSFDDDELDSEIDRLTQQYLSRVLSHLHRKLNFVTMMWKPRTGAGAVRRGRGGKQPAAKRRRM
jgi:ankyrin repeat protein